MAVRVVCISDTHWHAPPPLPAGDLVIHAGDGTEWEGFPEWVRRNKVLALSGNHDAGSLPLNDCEVETCGLRIYGMPWTPQFGDWHYMLPRNSWQLEDKVGMIPEGLDVLVTHGPPFGCLDKTHSGGASLGCELLAARLRDLRQPPRLHLFGHIHGGYGLRDFHHLGGVTVSVNASICDESYRPANRPVVVVL